MPVRHCIAVDCTSDSRKDKNINFFQLPKVDSVRKKWLNLVRREGLHIRPAADIRHYVVCSKHFVDGGPTVANPLPTLFPYNSYKQSTPRKTKNSHHGRTCDKFGSEPSPKKVKFDLVKCKEDKTQLCYPYVSGEVEVPCISIHDDNINNSAQQYGSQSNQPAEEHNYICENPEQKYCQQDLLLEKITSLEAKCRGLEMENKRLKEENKELKTRKEEPNYDNVQKLTYLEMCINETLRLYPPATRTDRECVLDTTLEGLKIPKGMIVGVPIYVKHHSAEYWEDPEKFDPERFSPENKAKHSPFQFIPFGYGPRNCIGMRLALLEAKMALAKVFKRFRLSHGSKTEMDQLELFSPKELWLNVHPRD